MSRLSVFPVGGPSLRSHSVSPTTLATATPPPRILIVTPEVAAAPLGLSPRARGISAKAGGLADVSASLARGLEQRGAEVHLAVPNYRNIYELDAETSFKDGLAESALPESEQRLHLAEDRAFYYRSHIYGGPEGHLAAAAFQREVINRIIAKVRPDLIHCHDWMTGLVPAFAKRHGIPCVFTVHNVHTDRRTLDFLEDRGIDTASFWQHLYFDRRPDNYEETRWSNPCDMLATGIHAADHVNVVSPNFLSEVVEGFHDFVPPSVRSALRSRTEEKMATGVVNSPDSSYDPASDPFLPYNYAPGSFEEGKTLSKLALQHRLGLQIDPEAPILFWPSRLDPVQKGCQLLTELLHRVVTDYQHLGLQVVAVADGYHQCYVQDIIRDYGLRQRVACVDFDESLSRLGYAGADFVLMPSLFEPCGLPQMIGARYGTLPIARNTGGIHDTVQQLDADRHRGNGFLFDHYQSGAFRWAIDEALAFYQLPGEGRNAEIRRVMRDAARDFSEDAMITRYVELYQQILERPLLPPPSEPARTLTGPVPVPESVSSARRKSELARKAKDMQRTIRGLAPLAAENASVPLPD